MDLSGTVGANSAMVILSFFNTTIAMEIGVRKNGDATEYYGGTTNSVGASLGRANQSVAMTLICVTDTSGIIEWKADYGHTSSVVKVIAYIK